MKKTLLLILTSLVCLAGCKKEENGFGPVTQEYPCSKCGAKYSVTCKNPNNKSSALSFGEDDWILYTNPSWGDWTVTDESGQNVPHYEALAGDYMYFICTCGEKSKEFKKADFKTQRPTIPTIR